MNEAGGFFRIVVLLLADRLASTERRIVGDTRGGVGPECCLRFGAVNWCAFLAKSRNWSFDIQGRAGIRGDFPPPPVLSALGQQTLRVVAETGELSRFTARGYASAVGSRRLGRRLVRAVYEQGVRCLPVILIVGLFTGLVLGLQGYHTLSRFGSTALLGQLVSLTLVRELAPVLAALMLVGQAGSALTAELGIQRNSEQIDALETMGIDPFGFLVAPRLLAALVVFPIMSGLFALVGLCGGWLSGCVVLALESGVYWSSIDRAVSLADVGQCMVKALVFGALTIALCCHNGFCAHRRSGSTGAQAVSASTTRAVVFSSIGVLAADYLITSLFV
ncbi:MAG: ABC transporter permease [Verrucomicrobia bacterium]|nr:MAG: ABC transporter permease [Verrucomicrobiota bacterium]